ncbi:MAG: hypothetical protein HQ523_14650 [Lentisphaerae bacterium]|nr:hypothetical protein [Lentisphaerota bacterium]
MKLQGSVTVSGREYRKGDDIPWHLVYPFFLVHMLMFGGSGFLMAYTAARPDIVFIYLHGGIAILVYTIFYLTLFGRDEVKWMFINAGLSIVGIYTQIGWILSLFGKEISDYPLYVHVTPFLYFVLYTFLLRHAVLDITHSREDSDKKHRVEFGYVAVLVSAYVISYFLKK